MLLFLLACTDTFCKICPNNNCTACLTDPISYYFHENGKCITCDLTLGNYLKK